MKFGSTLTTLVTQTLEAGTTTALVGEPGIGKSSFVTDLARSMNTAAFVLPCNQLAAKEDLTGARLVKDDHGNYSQVFFPHHVIQEAITYAEANPREYPILFLDEINRTTSDVTSGVLTLVTLRRMGHVELPTNLRLMIAGNDRGNVTTLDEASLSRFVLLRVEPDATTFMEILGDRLNPWVRTVLSRRPHLIFQKEPTVDVLADGPEEDEDGTASIDLSLDSAEEMHQITTPRTIEDLSTWLNIAGRDQLVEYLTTSVETRGRQMPLLAEVLESFTGNTAFTAELLSVMADDLNSAATTTPANRVTVPTPTCYSDLKAKTTITDLAAAIGQLTDNEKAGSLLQALSEREDNTRLVEQLALETGPLEQEHTKTLIQIVSSDQFDRENLRAFLDVDAPVPNSMRTALSGYL